jgi:hypothetical protein
MKKSLVIDTTFIEVSNIDVFYEVLIQVGSDTDPDPAGKIPDPE